MGAGAIATVESDDAGDPPDRNVAREDAIYATNRLLHLLSYAGGNQKAVPGVGLHDVEDLLVTYTTAAGDLIQFQEDLPRHPVRIHFEATITEAAVQLLLDPMPAEFAPVDALWNEAVQAFYDGRYREALIVVRASIEEAWRVAADGFIARASQANLAPVRQELVTAYIQVAEKAGLIDRLGLHTERVFGKKLEALLPPGDWDRLGNALEERNKVAHTAEPADVKQVWDGVRIARDVIDQLVKLGQMSS
jgi:hypothetical protein